MSSLARFRKKLTVIGIIGHTQGVSKAMKPPTIPIRKIPNNDLSLLSFSALNAFSSLITGCQSSEAVAAPAPAACTESPGIVPPNSAVFAVSVVAPGAAAASPISFSPSLAAVVSVAAGASAGPLPE